MWRIIFLIIPLPAFADSLIAARNLPARTLIAAEDITIVSKHFADAISEPSNAIGQETRVAIYAGRPIRASDLNRPAIVERNTRVTLVYRAGDLTITTEGRALSRGGTGEEISVLNLSSKTTVGGLILPDGQVLVGTAQ